MTSRLRAARLCAQGAAATRPLATVQEVALPGWLPVQQRAAGHHGWHRGLARLTTTTRALARGARGPA